MDVLVAALASVVTVPIWIGAALAVLFSSRGRVLYGGPRVGRHGKTFVMYKFRTMEVARGEASIGITAWNDPRITRVGRFLRATKVDELPQLINVIRGDMSLVGPRPEVPEFVMLEDPVQRVILSVRPGITGPTQLAYRHEEQLLDHASVEHEYRTEIQPAKLATDLEYVRTRTLRRDARLLLDTLALLMSSRERR